MNIMEWLMAVIYYCNLWASEGFHYDLSTGTMINSATGEVRIVPYPKG